LDELTSLEETKALELFTNVWGAGKCDRYLNNSFIIVIIIIIIIIIILLAHK